MKTSKAFYVFTLAVVMFFNSTSLFAADYEIIDLGGLGDGDSYAFGINNHGQVVGQSNNTAFLWQNGVMTSLGTLGGAVSQARDINDSGIICGISEIASGEDRGFMWSSTLGMMNLGTLGGDLSRAYSINNSNEIVGNSSRADGLRYAFKWDPINSFIDLGSLGGNHNFAVRINDSSEVVGGSRVTNNGATHAFIWDSATGMVDIAPSYGAVPTGINELAQVVGSFYDSSEWHVFLWDASNGFQDLNILSEGWGANYSINDSGIIIGELVGYTAFLYDSNTNELKQLIDLIAEDSGWDSLERAFDINDAGQIVGCGIKDGERRAYLLTPAAVPEPSVIFLFLFGGAWLLKSIKRK